MKENKNIIIVLLIIIIAILVTLVVLFTTNTISFNSNVKGNNDLGNGFVDSKNNDNTNSDLVNKLSEDEAIMIGKDLYDKATEIHENWVVLPYCGFSIVEIHKQKQYDFTNEEPGSFPRGFYKTMFKNYEHLKEYLREYLSDDIINSSAYMDDVVSDFSLLDSYDGYVNYLEKDGSLYCRLDTGKGWLSSYIGRYDIGIDSIEDTKIIYNIKSYYLSAEVFNNSNSECNLDNIHNCSDEEIVSKDTKFIIEKNSDGSFIVTDYTLHD